MKRTYHTSIRCYFPGEKSNYTQHHQKMHLKDIPKWIEAYAFTHPNVEAISLKVWPRDKEEDEHETCQ